MGSLQSWRKAYGAFKDSTKVGLAKVNSDFKVSLKTLIVIHRILRDGDPTFKEELLNFSQKAHILQLSNFKDDSSPIAWDLSAWVRTYALYLEERLECFRILKYDVEAERLIKPIEDPDKGYSRIRNADTEEMLEQLPALQQLLYRLVGCRPEGAAVGNYVIQYALTLEQEERYFLAYTTRQCTYRQPQPTYGVAPNPFAAHDPLSSSTPVAPPSGVQMAAIAQQQHMMVTATPNPFLYYDHQQQQRQKQTAANPFGDVPFGPYLNHPSQYHQSNPFENSGLIL